ncbi:hypothetical protein ACFU8T_09570 [Sphingobacterium spiritivorum]|uniref:Uncharacterized protein n=1 Tax=Sphingobacterium spiritivorum ATCC 33861 TaxID=525373 RepID=D7VS52_SPHSI|nr:hypothetical protein [Sphingobacterium spiritivorum]EFK56603.1 hypothetical protein HMPREF0766_13806 [Sphingobacterium spiritivorum ATCC 33861]QQT35348.1 hypothetical protein I6J01_19010 [Sphingobacterium spiritivorum]WQD32030.1 hypothetical protein U0038_10960 [Sphingobacterium spiritivorum]SUJ05069.1 Uncharacterised protein [Sphingobacterium spiritivorum]
MKKLFVITLFISILAACKEGNKKGLPNQSGQPEIADSSLAKVNEGNQLQEIEKSGSSFYDWYFNNNFQYIDVVKNRKGKSSLDTASYFKKLRDLGTISEKFIREEKKRLSGCNLFLETVNFEDYENADAYKYDTYCGDLYYMYWIKSQEPPDEYTIHNVKQLSDNKGSMDIYLNYGGEGEPLCRIDMEREGDRWKIVHIDFFNKSNPPTEKQKFYGYKWQNGEVALNIGESSLAFEYHGQCVYFYPVRKISDTEFEMIWERDVDCKFDNGTTETFGLQEVPQIGKPFARFTLKDNILYATYYYKPWVKAYSQKVQENVFTETYFKRSE